MTLKTGSSLLMLVAAFVGEEALKSIYSHAISNTYRFYSFGDSSLLTRQQALHGEA